MQQTRSSNQDAAWEQEEEEETGTEESDEPEVQSDEEDVQPDLTLSGLQDVGTLKVSDDSDPAEDLPSG